MRTIPRPSASLAAILALVVVLAGCTSVPQPGPAGDARGDSGEDDAAVAMKDFKFEPADLVVSVGTTVEWTNHDPVQHTVTPTEPAFWGTPGSGDDPAKWLDPDATWSFRFTKPGVYAYYCKPHSAQGSHGEWSGMVGTVTVTASGAGAGSDGGAGFQVPNLTVVPSPIAPPRQLPGADGIVHIALESREVVAQLANGAAYEFWTFGGTVPGPLLRVREGDTVEVALHNAPGSQHTHSIDLHAVTGPGGGAMATQVSPGQEKSFQFQARDPGLYVYHCATAHVPTHIANGMYGLILVEPQEGLAPVDDEFYVVQGETYTSSPLGAKSLQTFSMDRLMDERPTYVTFNGRVGALTGTGAMHAIVNDTVRIFFGVGGAVPSSFHVIGEVFDRVLPDGNGPVSTNRQTVLVPAAGAAILEFGVEYPGTFTLVDHTLTRAVDRGAAGQLVVEGPADPAVFRAPG